MQDIGGHEVLAVSDPVTQLAIDADSRCRGRVKQVQAVGCPPAGALDLCIAVAVRQHMAHPCARQVTAVLSPSPSGLRANRSSTGWS